MEFDEDFLKSVINESFVSPKVERRDSPGKGVGLFATETIFKDEIVSISGGVVIRSEDWKKYKNEFGDYAYNIEEDFMIMPLNPKDPSDDWRMNHCCDANCGLRGQIVFVAMKNIEPGEELLFDYAMTES
ncbi:MAG: SET domain-containing protein, partial [Leptospiraceae bacterium]|nr:SET domain-containing protein [Leptospiraceae bacterium]